MMTIHMPTRRPGHARMALQRLKAKQARRISAEEAERRAKGRALYDQIQTIYDRGDIPTAAQFAKLVAVDRVADSIWHSAMVYARYQCYGPRLYADPRDRNLLKYCEEMTEIDVLFSAYAKTIGCGDLALTDARRKVWEDALDGAPLKLNKATA